MFAAAKQFSAACLIAAGMAAAASVEAHQQQEAYTTLLFNPRSGNVEISHRFYSHDAEFVLAKHLGRTIDLTSEIKHRVEFSHYIASTFELTFGDAPPASLVNIGSELEGQYIWVYQETPIPAEVCDLSVKMTAFHEIWPQQANHINVEVGDSVQSARLTADNDSRRFVLAKCAD